MTGGSNGEFSPCCADRCAMWKWQQVDIWPEFPDGKTSMIISGPLPQGNSDRGFCGLTRRET